jgi:hypothetical protein
VTMVACGTYVARAPQDGPPGDKDAALTCGNKSGRRESNPHDQLGSSVARYLPCAAELSVLVGGPGLPVSPHD